MKYTTKLINTNYLDYNFILPKHKLLRKNTRFIALPFIFLYLFLCSSLLVASIPVDGYRSLRYKYLKIKR